jgi:hypothetical protein
MELYLRDMLRRVDSSLLEEWERMRDSDYQPGAAGEELRPPRREEAPDVTRDKKAFTAAVRTRVFAFLRAWSIGDDDAALDILGANSAEEGEPWTRERLRAAREAYLREHEGGLRLDPEGRSLRHTHVSPSEDGAHWRLEQMLVDPEGLNDWVAELEVDLARSREAGEPVLRLRRIETFA